MRDLLIIQTAFAGDLILTTPLIEQCAHCFPGIGIDVLCIPGTASLLAHNPHVREVLPYDKQSGKPGLLTLTRRLSRKGYEICIVPHRSFRSAILARATRARRRVSFDRSAASWLYTDTVRYADADHEVERNRTLLSVFDGARKTRVRPALYPSEDDRMAAARSVSAGGTMPMLCLAPGSVWATKRWTQEGFIEVGKALCQEYQVVLIGGAQDAALCAEIAGALPPDRVVNTAGKLSFLASAALVGMSRILISNDSAPVHVASAMGTPVVEIYGATSPEYGFTPYGVPHRIVQREGLACKPCAIHGGHHCPITTFDCMRGLSARSVIEAVRSLLDEVSPPL